jgi:hypothetical protein
MAARAAAANPVARAHQALARPLRRFAHYPCVATRASRCTLCRWPHPLPLPLPLRCSPAAAPSPLPPDPCPPPHARRGVVISAAEALSATTLAALGLATVGAVAASASMLGDGGAKDPRRLTQTGMAKFRANKVEESVEVRRTGGLC